MGYQKSIATSLLLLCSVAASGKDKKKVLLPDDVLEARTAFVMIDPDTDEPLNAPRANSTARNDVEEALIKWGRFSIAADAQTADLVVTVRKGTGRLAQATVGGLPTDDRPPLIGTDSSGRIGGGQRVPPGSNPTGSQMPTPQIEVGASEDVFALYRAGSLSAAPVWRYSAKDALRSPGVPAVDVFRKLVVEAEKQRAARP